MGASVTPAAAEAALDDSELRAWKGLRAAYAALVKRLDAELEEAHGLPLSSYEVLLALDSAPGRRMRMCDLADTVFLSRSGLTRLVDRLERDGLLCRACCSVDARGAYAVLTEAGAERLAEARPTHRAAVRDGLASRYSADELRELCGALDRLRD